jgi:alpha-L-fucosidase
MMIRKLVFVTALVTLCFAAGGVAADKYEPTWESITTHENPEWFRDAKFGIYFHWGPYSVPAFENEWYSRRMYRDETLKRFGREINFYRHHREHWGPQDTFGYKDLAKLFTAEKFDPEDWAELFLQAGARFAGPVAEHADGFAMWDSALTDWDAKDVGPRRDIVGLLEKSIKKRGLKFTTTFHHGWNWDWFPVWDKSTDASDPRYKGLYGPIHNEGDPPTPEFHEEWKGKLVEVIDKYQPDLIWFDSKLRTIDDQVRREFLAYYYNKEAEWGRQVGVTYKREDLPLGAGILDLERGRMSQLQPYPWLNDDSIDWRSWSYITAADYKSTNRLIDGLVDIVSKNGCLLLNFGPRADGTIPAAVRTRLLEMGQWLKVNGEAIYDTRPWYVHGEGPTRVAAGSFGEREVGDFTARDIRFTRNGDTVYAIALAWPGDNQVVEIDKLSTRFAPETVSTVTLLGHAGRVRWERDRKGLRVTMPAAKPGEHAFVLKVETK